MKRKDIEKKAKSLNIENYKSYSPSELIKAIQRNEGNFDCFDTGRDECDQLNCCWREDCLK